MVGADLAEPLQFLVGGAAGDHFRARHFREQHATGAHAAAGAENKHRLAGLEASPGEQHPVRGSIGDGQRGGDFVADGIGQGHQLFGMHGAVLGAAAVELLADKQPVRRFAGQGVDQHPLAHRPAVHAFADFHDLARHVRADDDRQRYADAGHAAARKDVVEVDGCCADPKDDPALFWRWPRVVVDEPDDIPVAMFVYNGCSHGQ